MTTPNNDLEYLTLEFQIENINKVSYLKYEDDILDGCTDLYIKITSEDKIIGEFSGYLFNSFYGNHVFQSIDCHSFELRGLLDGLICDESDNFIAPWEDDCIGNKFIAVEKMEIDPGYRGKGIAKRLFEWLDFLFNAPILLEAFPLQFSLKNNPKGSKIGLRQARKKVVDAYLKCGFLRCKPRSNILYRLPNE